MTADPILPTGLCRAIELPSPSDDISEVLKIRRSPDLQTLELWKGRSSFSYFGSTANVLNQETTLERADLALQLLLFVIAEKRKENCFLFSFFPFSVSWWFQARPRPNVSHFCGLKNSSIEVWGSQTTSIKALESRTQHKNNCFSVKAKFKLFFRQTSLHQNVKHLVGNRLSTLRPG